MGEATGSGNLWTIVLAGGEGQRLGALTRALHGHEVPKQFAALTGSESPLAETVRRFGAVVPFHRQVVVVAAHHAELATTQLAPFPGVEIVAQPHDRGTGVGVLPPLCSILAQDAEARVIVTPGHHHVLHAEAMLRELARVSRVIARSEIPALVGVVPEGAPRSESFVLPGAGLGGAWRGLRALDRFIDATDDERALGVPVAGALCNTGILVASAAGLWKQLAALLPRQSDALRRTIERGRTPDAAHGMRDAEVLERVYSGLDVADLDRDVVRKLPRLVVVPIVRSGWNSWSTARDVFASLAGTHALQELLRRIESGPREPLPR